MAAVVRLLSTLCLLLINDVNAQCPGTETFEKVTGVSLRGANEKRLFASSGNAVTAECNNRCRAQRDCSGFSINYETESCFELETNFADGEVSRADLVPTRNKKINYFEKICLRAPACEKAWIYERVPGFELAGYDDEVIQNVPNRISCEELCLRRKDLPCRSAEYVYTSRLCKMSKETRRSQPASYRASTSDVDYLENQCSQEQVSKTCNYLEYENQDLGFGDLQLDSESKEDCEMRCDTTTAFNCRSYTFVPDTNTCRLSGDDNISTGPAALEVRQGANYYQKAPCVDLGLVCTATSMTVTLNTEEAFRGKLFAFQNPKQCAIRGTGATETSLTFDYEDPNQRCGTKVEEEGVFTNTIVIQHHPIIQQKGDRAIKLYCFFEISGDKVVTNSYDVITETVGPGGPFDPSDPRSGDLPLSIPTSVVNGTAPQPKVLLRIVNAEGNDITGTKLGEPLFLRIELDGESIFDIFARNLVAQSGIDEEEIQLLDDRGCPTDPVFPGLRKDPETGALLGRFEAFKFSDTTVVNFQVNVQFCQDECNPVDCGDGVQSYGKRRKRSTGGDDEKEMMTVTNKRTGRQLIMPKDDAVPRELAERLVYDPDLGQEVIVYDTPLRKQIRVDPGTKVDEFKDPAVRTGGSGGVFIEGNYNPDDVFCASWTVVLVTAASFLFLQMCILVVCVLCICASRRTRKEEEQEYDERASRRYHESLQSGRSSVAGGVINPAYQTSMGYGDGSMVSSVTNTAAYMRGHGQPQQPHSSSARSTLKSLRTSLRD